MVNNKIKGYAAICMYSILSGVSFAWTKNLLEKGFGVFTIITIRLALAALFLFSVLLITKKMERMHAKDFWWFVLLSLCEPFIYFIGEDFGMQYVSASFASVIIALIPIMVALLMPIFYHTKFQRRLIFGTSLSLVGIFIMSYDGAGFTFDFRGLGLLVIALLSAVFFNIVLERLLKTYGAFSVTMYIDLIGCVMYLPLFLLFDANKITSFSWDSGAITSLLCLGILCSGLSYSFYSFGGSRLGVEKVSVFNNAAPIVTVIASIVMGLEPFSITTFVAVLIVVFGVVFSQGNIHLKHN